MNERILELAKQCGYWSGQTIEMNDVGIEKFAELIVRECMEQLNISNVPAPISAGLNLGRVAIKEHFGVDE